MIDLHSLYQRFTQYLTPHTTILDAGSGSGRDTKYFLESGYQVVGIDASEEMVKLSSLYTGQETLHLTFEKIPYINAFDAIWCSASLVHTPPSKLPQVLRILSNSLKDQGIWFLSFMHGDFEETRGGRYFHHLTETKLKAFVEDVGNLEILDLFISASCEQGRNSEWIQCIVRKKPCPFCMPSSAKIFTKIREETAQYYIVEDNFPVTEGHLLLISKKHFVHWFEADVETQQDAIVALQKAKEYLEKTYQSDGYNVGFNCKTSAGQTISHLHLHVIPRRRGDTQNPEGGVRGAIPEKQKYIVTSTPNHKF